MYYGQVVVSQYSMDKLLSAAKELEINGLLTNVVKPIPESIYGKKRIIPCPKSIISDPKTLQRDIFVSSRPAALGENFTNFFFVSKFWCKLNSLCFAKE